MLCEPIEYWKALPCVQPSASLLPHRLSSFHASPSLSLCTHSIVVPFARCNLTFPGLNWESISRCRKIRSEHFEMRLLNAKSLKLHVFIGAETPPYVILSHTWGEEEISFQDITTGNPSHLKGWQKVKCCCAQAVSDGYDYVWIDTCCVDKTSSTELSEAINSMFRWYHDSEICYAYLSDIDSEQTSAAQGYGLESSRWFTRGWTLQELIAPADVVFYDANWCDIGTKNSLCNLLSSITGIHIEALLIRHHTTFSVAQRMSWASSRNTTRPEDEAYCLLGLFDVNMPLLYGEGRKAFMRLQEEIMKQSEDHTLFAWNVDIMADRMTYSTGLLANSPCEFSKAGNIESITDEGLAAPYSVTNRGIQITLPLVNAGKSSHLFRSRFFWRPYSPVYDPNEEIAILNCQFSDARGQRIGILLKLIKQSGSYLRTHHNFHLLTPGTYQPNKQASSSELLPRLEMILVGSFDVYFLLLRGLSFTIEWNCTIRSLPAPSHGFYIRDVYPRDSWDFMSGVRGKVDHSRHADLFFMGPYEYGFMVTLQKIGRIVCSEVQECSEEEFQRDPFRYFSRAPSRPRDHIEYGLRGGKTVEVRIRKNATAYMVDISIKDKVSTS
jgi:hypothetical protein